MRTISKWSGAGLLKVKLIIGCGSRPLDLQSSHVAGPAVVLAAADHDRHGKTALACRAPYTQAGARLQGYDQEGVDDLVSGVLMGSYHSGGGGGPLIGGAMKHGLGFPWSGAVFAAIFAAQVGLCRHCFLTSAREDHVPGLNAWHMIRAPL